MYPDFSVVPSYIFDSQELMEPRSVRARRNSSCLLREARLQNSDGGINIREKMKKYMDVWTIPFIVHFFFNGIRNNQLEKWIHFVDFFNLFSDLYRKIKSMLKNSMRMLKNRQRSL